MNGFTSMTRQRIPRRKRIQRQHGWFLFAVMGLSCQLELSRSFQLPSSLQQPRQQRLGSGLSNGLRSPPITIASNVGVKSSRCKLAAGYEPQLPFPSSSPNNHKREKKIDRRSNSKGNKEDKLVVLQQSSADSIEQPGNSNLMTKNPVTALIGKVSEQKQQQTPSSSPWMLSLLFPLWLVYVSNQWSRFSLPYLVDFAPGADSFHAMNVNLNFDQSQYGMLASVAFTALFAIFSLVAGVASDRYDRKLLTIGSAFTWSLATLGTSLSHSYDEVLGWRILMGFACAFTTPTAYTLLQQYVPSHKSGLASSLYGSGVALGGGLAGLTVLLDTSYGWSDALRLISFFGFASVLLASICLPSDSMQVASSGDGKQDVWIRTTPKSTAAPLQEVSTDTSLITDKKNSHPDEEAIGKASNSVISTNHEDSLPATATSETTTIADEILQVVSTSRIQWLFVGSMLRFCSGMCIGIWSAPYFRLAFPDHISEYAYAQACITAICGISSNIMGGLIADWISSSSQAKETSDCSNYNDDVGRKLWVPITGSLLATPAWYMAIHSATFEFSMVWLALEYMLAECWFGPTINVLQSTVNSKVEGTAQGMFAFTGALGNLAPTMLGFILAANGHNSQETPTELTGLLSIAVCGGYISSALCFAMSATSKPTSTSSKSPMLRQSTT